MIIKAQNLQKYPMNQKTINGKRLKIIQGAITLRLIGEKCMKSCIKPPLLKYEKQLIRRRNMFMLFVLMNKKTTKN